MSAQGGRERSVHVQLQAPNGEIILPRETSTTKAAALDGIASVRKNALADSNYDRKTATKGWWYFTLLTANMQTLGRGETYSSVSAMENASLR